MFSVEVLISGASGLVGSALTRSLTAGGHRVRRLVRRRPTGPGAAFWDPAAGELEPAATEGIDAVVHLAGENIAGGRWTAAFKRRILDSRVAGTELIAAAVAASSPPPVLVSASAIGYYGDRGERQVDEASTAGPASWPTSAGGGRTRRQRPKTPAREPCACASESCSPAMAERSRRC